MNQLIEFLSRPENHGTRNFLKWLQVILGGWTGAGAATGSWQSLFTGILFVLVKWLEAEASKMANESRMSKGEPEIEDEDDKPNSSQIWSKSEAPTEKLQIPWTLPREIVIPRVTTEIPRAFPDAEEIQAAETKLAGGEVFKVEYINERGKTVIEEFTDKTKACLFKNRTPYAKLLP